MGCMQVRKCVLRIGLSAHVLDESIGEGINEFDQWRDPSTGHIRTTPNWGKDGYRDGPPNEPEQSREHTS